jgi:hypothetical protein
MSSLLKMFALLLIFSPLAFAQETKAEKTSEAKSADAADEAITNRKLRAETGSLSKWSVSTFFDYSGGNLADPTNPERRNITASADALELQSLSGSVGVRYRISALNSMTASTGFFMSTPFHDSIRTNDPETKKEFEKTNRKLNVSDPSLSFTHLNKLLGVQSVSSLSGTLITNNQLENRGYESYWSAGQTFMYDVGKTGLSFGLSMSYGYYTHSKDPAEGDQLATNNLGFYPAVEYVINDTLNVRTVSGMWVFQQTTASASDTWDKLKVYQSVGLGISVARDVFLYPNFQFIPTDIRADRTNIAISASINVF